MARNTQIKNAGLLTLRFNDARLLPYRLPLRRDKGLGVAEAIDCSRLLFIQEETSKLLHKH